MLGLLFERKETLRAAWLVLGLGAALSVGLAAWEAPRARPTPRGLLLGWGTFLLVSPTIYSWYLMPVLQIFSFARRHGRAEWALWDLTFTVLISHTVLLRPAGVTWEPPLTARLLEFGVPVLIFALMRRR